MLQGRREVAQPPKRVFDELREFGRSACQHGARFERQEKLDGGRRVARAAKKQRIDLGHARPLACLQIKAEQMPRGLGVLRRVIERPLEQAQRFPGLARQPEVRLRRGSPAASGSGHVAGPSLEKFAEPLEGAGAGLRVSGFGHAALEHEPRRLDVFGAFGEPLEKREHGFVERFFVEKGSAEGERLLVSAARGERLADSDERHLALVAGEAWQCAPKLLHRGR